MQQEQRRSGGRMNHGGRSRVRCGRSRDRGRIFRVLCGRDGGTVVSWFDRFSLYEEVVCRIAIPATLIIHNLGSSKTNP